jgi:hypothetical protein
MLPSIGPSARDAIASYTKSRNACVRTVSRPRGGAVRFQHGRRDRLHLRFSAEPGKRVDREAGCPVRGGRYAATRALVLADIRHRRACDDRGAGGLRCLLGAGGAQDIYVMEPEAAGEGINLAVQVTHFSNGEYIGEPVWSPDGTRIAFVTGTVEGNRKVEVANSNGTTATPVVVAEHGQHPSWAPDSGKIAYSEGAQVFLKNADGSGPATPLAGAAGREPTWSPDGTRIAFDAPAGLSTVNLGIISATGGTPTPLTSGAQWTFSSWSPSGAQAGYLVSGGGEDTHWRVANADGSGDHPLTEIQQLAPGSKLSWSPDGHRVVYGGFDFGGGADTNQVYMENTDGSGSVTTLTGDEEYEPYPAWRPSPAAAPQVFTPAGGSTAPLPPTRKPKTVWITKRIPWTPGPDLTLIVLSVGCSAPACNVGGQLTIDVTLTVASPGQPAVVDHHTVKVFVKKQTKRKHKRS